MATHNDRPMSPTPSQLPPVPASPTYSYASTANPFLSQYSLPLPPPPPPPVHAVLTKTDLEGSQAAYAELIASAKSYRQALASLSTAASTFGSALEACARLKEARAELGIVGRSGPKPSTHHAGSLSPAGPPLPIPGPLGSTCTADSLLTVAGLQHLVANHQQILSETVYRSFEVPLLHELDKWRAAVEEEEDEYARAAAQQGAEIRRLEREGIKQYQQEAKKGRGRRGGAQQAPHRDLRAFREHLVDLTSKLDGLTGRHVEHAATLLRESQETSARIVDASCSLARAEVDIFESLARKGWTGGGLDDVLERGVDLFASEETGADVSARVGGGALGGTGGSGTGGAGGGAPGGTGAASGASGGGGGGAKLFSILPPKSILADSGADGLHSSGMRVSHLRTDSLLVMDGDRYQSLTGAADVTAAGGWERGGGGDRSERDHDADSIFSEFNRSRGARPFSPVPQPIRLNPDNLIVGSLETERGELSSSAIVVAMVKGGDDGEGRHSADEAEKEEEEGREDDDSEQAPGVGKGKRSSSNRAASNGRREDDDEEVHPWRDEGLDRAETETETESSEGASPGTETVHDGTW